MDGWLFVAAVRCWQLTPRVRDLIRNARGLHYTLTLKSLGRLWRAKKKERKVHVSHCSVLAEVKCSLPFSMPLFAAPCAHF